MKNKFASVVLGSVTLLTAAALVVAVMPHTIEWPDWLAVSALLH